MLLREEPLDDLLFIASMMHDISPERETNYYTSTRDSMDKLETLLDHNQRNPKKRDLTDSHLTFPFMRGIGKLSPKDLKRAQQLLWRVARERGSGSLSIQEALFGIIALSLNPSITVPFLVEVLDFSQPRDSFTKRRRRIALAILALLAIQTNDAASYTALQQTAQHATPDVRGLAVGYLGRAYLDAERPLPPDVQQLLHTIATSDKAFLPRYKARMHLDKAHIAVPLDHPDGVFLFKVKFQHARRIYRTIAIRSTQTLHDLHMEIQDAIEWDDDHLYSFFLYGKRGDDPDARVVGPWEDEQADDAGLPAHHLQIGMLGFVPKHTFRYLFDYGDMNEFEIDVVGIEEQAEPGDYPRVVDSKGKAPAQYGWDDDEDVWEE